MGVDDMGDWVCGSRQADERRFFSTLFMLLQLCYGDTLRG